MRKAPPLFDETTRKEFFMFLIFGSNNPEFFKSSLESAYTHLLMTSGCRRHEIVWNSVHLLIFCEIGMDVSTMGQSLRVSYSELQFC